MTIHSREDLQSSGATGKHLHLAIGMFDGVHIGHQSVLRQAVEAASREEHHFSGVLTFDPHPSRILHPEGATSLLMPLEQRIQKIFAAGIDFVFVQTFTRRYAMQKATEFVPGLQRQFPSLKSIHVGENFRFGAGRSGDVTTLRDTAAEAGVELHALKRASLDGMAISSSRIRLALVEGSMEEVTAMLGHPYLVEGEVVAGKGLGRQLDFPTLNVAWSPEVAPRFGVYQVYLRMAHSSALQPGIANYGLRPTVEQSSDPRLEVHLLDPTRVPATGDHVQVALMAFLRPEKTFSSAGELREQIRLDVGQVRTRIAGRAVPPDLPF